MNAINRAEEIDDTVDVDSAAVSQVEDGIRDFVRNDIAYLRRPAATTTTDAPPLDPSAEATVTNVNSLIQRVAGTSLAEIENLISELESLRDLLHAEGQRVQREISGYAQLSQAAMKSTRMISDNVAQWKREFTRDLGCAFLLRFPDTLKSLGYETNNSWVSTLRQPRETGRFMDMKRLAAVHLALVTELARYF